MATVNLTLNIPDGVQTRVLAAIRGTYPDITLDLADLAAVKAVVRHWIRDTLAAFEGQQAAGDVMGQVEQARQSAVVKANTDSAPIQ